MVAQAVTVTDQIFWTRQTAAQMLGVSISTLDRLDKNDPTFPQKIRLGKRRAGWRSESIKKWLEERGND